MEPLDGMIGQPPNLAKMQARDLKRYASLEWREWYSRPSKHPDNRVKPSYLKIQHDPIEEPPKPS